MKSGESYPHHVVIIGGGFGGLYAAKSLGCAPVKVTLVDKRNFHLFQPLLYQVATGNVAAEEIAASLRATLSPYKNVHVLLDEVLDIDADERKVILSDGELSYDTLIVATGVTPHYFGHDEWSQAAVGLKTVEDAQEMRRRILFAFEAAERETDPERRRAWMTFVVIGAGSAGVELSGALGELAHETLQNDFRSIDPAEAEVLLVEAADRILPAYPPQLSAKAEAALARLGVTVWTRARVTDITGDTISVSRGDRFDRIEAHTMLWTAGIRASPMANVLARRTDANLDRLQRVIVEPDLSITRYPDIFVIGDLASFSHQRDELLPALAPVAIQQGQYVARLIRARLAGRSLPGFSYFDKGNVAVIGRNTAVVQLGRFKSEGFIAWLLWVVIHIYYLVGFDQKMLVMFRWVWNYFTRRRGARLITQC